MLEILQNIPAIMAILPALLVINAVLSGVSVALQKLVDLGTVKKDSSVVTIVAKVAGFLKMILDILAANVKH